MCVWDLEFRLQGLSLGFQNLGALKGLSHRFYPIKPECLQGIRASSGSPYTALLSGLGFLRLEDAMRRLQRDYERFPQGFCKYFLPAAMLGFVKPRFGFGCCRA